MHRIAILGLLLIGWTACAQAEPRRIAIAPPSSEVEFRAYKMGLVPLDGSFRAFSGWLSYDPDNRRSCEVHLTIAAASLAVPEPAMQNIVAGPDFLDVARYPSLTYSGTCSDDRVNGTLNMHGVAGAFPLALTWSPGGVSAEGRLVRADWGMTALPLLAGRTIRIQVVIPLKMNAAAGN
jgi:polyisoprenoid-binding protein YceI